MRHVLIVEDNVLKEARIRDVLSLIPEIEFTVCRSVKAAYPLLEVQQNISNSQFHLQVIRALHFLDFYYILVVLFQSIQSYVHL